MQPQKCILRLKMIDIDRIPEQSQHKGERNARNGTPQDHSVCGAGTAPAVTIKGYAQLGMKLPETHTAPDFTQADWQKLRDVPNIRVAVGLAEVGRDGLADEVLRHQARIGSSAQYQPLSRLARALQ